MRSAKPFRSRKILKMVYYAYYHSVMIYGLLFGRNSPHTAKLFTIKKNIITINT
jgi:hypothetical protein